MPESRLQRTRDAYIDDGQKYMSVYERAALPVVQPVLSPARIYIDYYGNAHKVPVMPQIFKVRP